MATQLTAPVPGELAPAPTLAQIARQWGRIGCVGFGGPPVHVALLRELCVEQRQWLTSEQFERAVAATNILPGPASTQLAIYCAWRLRGVRGALLGGVCFIVPGLAAIIALAALFLSASPPVWVRGAGMGAGAAVAPVAVRAGLSVALPIWHSADSGDRRRRVLAYGLAGALSVALLGPWLVLVLLACGLCELAGAVRARTHIGNHAWLALAWTALKIGALAFGGGFVIVPLLQSDAVSTYHWMTHGQFLDAVALGQITPGPLVQTVAVVGYAAAGLPGALLAGLVAFSPSFSFILIGGSRFERLLTDARARAFLAGAAPCAAGAIIGAAIPLTGALTESWQYAVLGAAALALLVARRAIVPTLLAAGCVGTIAALLGAPITP
jgi:chromate transporter